MASAGAGDLDELYRRLSASLLRIVRHSVRAPDPVIEDACQSAWSRLLRHQHRVQRETVLSWLVTTAVHEALKLVQRAGSELSFETAIEQGVQFPASGARRSPEAVAEDRERLASLGKLSQRQQRFLWLYGLGLSYEEIARIQGCTSRTVERQLQHARASLHAREARSERCAAFCTGRRKDSLPPELQICTASGTSPTAPARAFAGAARLG